MFALASAILSALLAFLGSGMWIGTACGLVGVMAMYISNPSAAFMRANLVVWNTINSYTLSAMPLFTFLGFILLECGLSKRVYDGVEPFTSHFPGGLLHTNIAIGALFAAATGSSVASSAAIGTITLPEMARRGYPRGLSLGAVAAGGILAPIIPPSVMMIIYGVLTGASVGKLFIAGIFPGLLLAGAFSLYLALRFRFFENWGARGDVSSWIYSLVQLKNIWAILVVIGAVLGTIYFGIATPTEAAAVGCVAVTVLAALHRTLTWQSLRMALVGTVKLTSVVMFVLIGADLLAVGLGMSGISYRVEDALTTLRLSPLAFLFLVYGIFLILGMFLDSLPMMVILVPLVFPGLAALGFDPIWFGVAVMFLTNIGNLTPPVGIVLFVLQSIDPDCPTGELYKGLTPFIVISLLVLIMLTFFPEIALFLPRLMRS